MIFTMDVPFTFHEMGLNIETSPGTADQEREMSSQPPKSFMSLLWDVLRIGARTFWQSGANPARPLMQRQQALAVLGLPLNATPQQIKRRYRTLAKRHHPDRGGDQRQMQRIIAAYEFLVKDNARSGLS